MSGLSKRENHASEDAWRISEKGRALLGSIFGLSPTPLLIDFGDHTRVSATTAAADRSEATMSDGGTATKFEMTN
jgi:hypothetical protein